MAGVAAALGSPAVGTLGFVFYESWTGSPGALNMVKGLAAGGVFLAISVATGLRRRAAGRAVDVGYLVASAFIGITLGDTAWLQALQLLGARKTILLNSLQPFIAWIFGVPPFPWPLARDLSASEARRRVVRCLQARRSCASARCRRGPSPGSSSPCLAWASSRSARRSRSLRRRRRAMMVGRRGRRAGGGYGGATL